MPARALHHCTQSNLANLKMRSRVGLALACALALLYSLPIAVRADCCGTANIETYQDKVSTCKDCSEPTPWCGKGPCNWFGE